MRHQIKFQQRLHTATLNVTVVMPCLHRRLMPPTRKPQGEAVVTLSRQLSKEEETGDG